MARFIDGVSGFGWMKFRGKYVAVFGDSEQVAIFARTQHDFKLKNWLND